jgi:hypothetical protein
VEGFNGAGSLREAVEDFNSLDERFWRISTVLVLSERLWRISLDERLWRISTELVL